MGNVQNYLNQYKGQPYNPTEHRNLSYIYKKYKIQFQIISNNSHLIYNKSQF